MRLVALKPYKKIVSPRQSSEYVTVVGLELIKASECRHENYRRAKQVNTTSFSS